MKYTEIDFALAWEKYAIIEVMKRFVELKQEEVEALDFPGMSFLQSAEMWQRYRDMGRECYFVGVKEKDEILAAGLMSARAWRLGKKVFRVPGGWILDYSREDYGEILEFLTETAKDFCEERDGIALEIAPNLQLQPRDAHNNILPGGNYLAVKQTLVDLGYKYLGEYEQVKWTFVLDLEGKTAEQLFKEFRTDHRQRIRRAEREKVQVRELGADELKILKEIAAEAGERHGFRDPDLDYYRSMKKAFGDKVKFVVAELPQEGGVKPLAAAMFMNYGGEMIYLYSGSVRELQKYGGAHLIQWKMIQEALEKGCKKYNFYGVRPVEGNGVYNFKLGFRGRVEELLGTFILPIGILGKLYVMRLKTREYGEVH